MTDKSLKGFCAYLTFQPHCSPPFFPSSPCHHHQSHWPPLSVLPSLEFLTPLLLYCSGASWSFLPSYLLFWVIPAYSLLKHLFLRDPHTSQTPLLCILLEYHWITFLLINVCYACSFPFICIITCLSLSLDDIQEDRHWIFAP